MVFEQVDAVEQGDQCLVEFSVQWALGQFGFQAFQPRVPAEVGVSSGSACAIGLTSTPRAETSG